jgi:hypothetical protein
MFPKMLCRSKVISRSSSTADVCSTAHAEAKAIAQEGNKLKMNVRHDIT